MQILITKRAENQFDKIINYIKLNWGNYSVIQFIQKVDNIFIYLSLFQQLDKLK